MNNNEYVIYNFINELLEGYYENGMPKLTCFEEDALIFDFADAKAQLSKLHCMGFMGLDIKPLKK